MKDKLWTVIFIILCIPTIIWCEITTIKNRVKRCFGGEKGLLTADERADVLNALNKVLEKFGLEVCGYEDDGTFFDIQIWKRRNEDGVTQDNLR